MFRMCSDVRCHTSKRCVERDVFKDLTIFCVDKPVDVGRPRHQQLAL